MNKRDFIKGTGLFSAAAVAASMPSGLHAGAEYRASSVFNVRDFGAKGDGATHDGKAIQAALDAAGKVEGAVYFPSGIYLCSELKAHPHTTLVAEPQWIFRGEDRGAVLKLDSEDAYCLLDITGAFGVRIRGLTLTGIPKSKRKIHGIFLNNCQKYSPKEDTVVIDDTKVQNFSGHGIYLKRIWLFIVRHSQCFNNGGCGMAIMGWDGFVLDNQFSGNGLHGFGCENVGSTVMFTSNRVEWNQRHGLYIPAGDTWNITGNSFDRNWGAGLKTENVTAVSVTGNLFRRCGKDSSMLPVGEVSAQVIFDGSKGLCVVGNSFRAGRDDKGKGKYTPNVGFILRRLSYSVIANNTLFGGYMDEMKRDLGSHGKDFVFENNVGCPMR